MEQSAPAEVHISSVSQEVARAVGNLMCHKTNPTTAQLLFRALWIQSTSAHPTSLCLSKQSVKIWGPVWHRNLLYFYHETGLAWFPSRRFTLSWLSDLFVATLQCLETVCSLCSVRTRRAAVTGAQISSSTTCLECVIFCKIRPSEDTRNDMGGIFIFCPLLRTLFYNKYANFL